MHHRHHVPAAPEPLLPPNHPPFTSPRALPNRPKYTGYAADQERARRYATHKDAYNAFLEAAHMRLMQRHDLATRAKIWTEARAKAEARLEATEKEREVLVKKVEVMEEVRREYEEANEVVGGSEREDEEVRGRWEAFFSLESGEMEMGG